MQPTTMPRALERLWAERTTLSELPAPRRRSFFTRSLVNTTEGEQVAVLSEQGWNFDAPHRTDLEGQLEHAVLNHGITTGHFMLKQQTGLYVAFKNKNDHWIELYLLPVTDMITPLYRSPLTERPEFSRLASNYMENNLTWVRAILVDQIYQLAMQVHRERGSSEAYQWPPTWTYIGDKVGKYLVYATANRSDTNDRMAALYCGMVESPENIHVYIDDHGDVLVTHVRNVDQIMFLMIKPER